jgi:Mn2+/Fe2+ NRAMP family transporter
LFNAVTLAFLFGFKNLYQAVERMMMVFVGLMLVAFAANLIYSGPNLFAFAKGLVPGGQSKIDLSVLALVGTTFVVTAAFYQSYLVRQKGWGPGELRTGIIDARVGAGIMAVITLVLMSTAATLLYPTFHKQMEITETNDSSRWEKGEIVQRAEFEKEVAALKTAKKNPPIATSRKLKNPTEVADQLKNLFGGWGRPIFCMGLFAAAFSSFLVNSMIGGFILSDGLGLGSRPEDPWPRRLTAVVLLTGMIVALVVLLVLKEQKPAQLIIFAQAITVIASPLMAGALWWLAANEDVMGEERNRPLANMMAGLGFVLLLAMSIRVAVVSVWPAISEMFG